MPRTCPHCGETALPLGDKVICDPCFENAGKFLEDNLPLIKAIPEMIESLADLIESADTVAANWENGKLDVAVRALVRESRIARILMNRLRNAGPPSEQEEQWCETDLVFSPRK